ncbi:MAG: XkdX family protein [Clostridia bacterium]
MTKIAESIKRIYNSENKTKEWLKHRVAKGTITTEEYKSITNET